MRLALREMARHYQVPVNLPGLPTSSMDIDAYYAYQGVSDCLLAYLAGADEIYSMGLLGQDMILSPEKMVLDNLFAGQIAAKVRMEPLDDEHLQAEAIARVGIGGHFPEEPETLHYTRTEYVPAWPPAGASIRKLVAEQARRLCNEHKAPPLPAGALESIQAALSAASKSRPPGAGSARKENRQLAEGSGVPELSGASSW
jgi:trimethylamine:corrinoid methyltransferase-like protein